MSEVIVTAAGSSYVSTPTELHLRRVFAGDVENVRARLLPALETLGYIVISEDPLQVHRGARGWAGAYMSADALEYPIKLTVALKQAGATTTRATFSYSVMHPWLIKGDHQSIAREVDAVVALAAVRAREAICPACGADATGDSRFCRVCGAPLAGGAPAELEVLRLTVGARAAHQTIISGVIMFLCALPFLLISAFGTKPAFAVGMTFFALLAVSALVTLLFGMRRMHRTLNPPAGIAAPAFAHPAAMPALAPPAMRATTGELAHTAPPSITEGTTELLYIDDAHRISESSRERVAVERETAK